MGFNDKVSLGTDGIEVKLINYTQDPIPTIYTFIHSTWGDLITEYDYHHKLEMNEIVKEALTGKRFSGQSLECVNYTFAISNVSRACTHQLVRTRIGAGFGQQGGRDNNWEHFDFRMPDTVAKDDTVSLKFLEAIKSIKEAYHAATSRGIPFQDARFICPIGLQTNIMETINLRALSTLCSNRLCNVMQWEINTVTRKMRDEVLKVHPVFEPILKPTCEKLGRCVAKPTLFPPCGKYPIPMDQKDKKFEHSHESNGNVLNGNIDKDKERLKK